MKLKPVFLADGALSGYTTATWACTGLAIMGIWSNLTGYSPVFFPAEETDFEYENFRYAYDFGRIIISAMFIFFCRFFDRQSIACRYIIPCAMCMGTVSLALANHQNLLDPQLTGIVGSLVCGFCYIWMVATFYIILARYYAMKTAIIAATVSQVLEQILAVALDFTLPSSIQVLCCTTLPLIALFAMSRAEHRHPKPCVDPKPKLKGAAEKHLVLLLVVVGAALVVIGRLSTVGAWGAARIDYSIMPPTAALAENVLACIILGFLAWFTLVKLCDEPASIRYQPPCLILITGLSITVIMVLLLEGQRALLLIELAQSFLMAVEYYSHLLLWTIGMACVQELRFPAYRTMGITLGVYSTTAFGWLFLIETSATLTAIIALIASYLLIVVNVIRPGTKLSPLESSIIKVEDMNDLIIDGEPKIPLEMSGESVATSLKKRCEILGKLYELSPKEDEVFYRLAQGCSLTTIEEKLVLSTGTVKTHISHIYTKMDVHSRQEIIDLVFDEKPRE